MRKTIQLGNVSVYDYIIASLLAQKSRTIITFCKSLINRHHTMWNA